ncbi:MAG: response regulator transcription factor [Planctomycetota bacterium]
MAKPTVLLIEDDPDIVEMVRYNLEREGFSVLSAARGEEGVELARRRVPDVVLLDLMLPGMDGLEVCRRLRADHATVRLPILMLTAKGEETDVVVGLEVGADEYVRKPFSPRELVARVRALLRRASQEPADATRTRVEIQDLVLDLGRYEASVHGAPLSLTRAEFRLLWALVRRPGRVFTRSELADEITAGECVILDRNVDVHVSSIRRKLGNAGELIATVRGVGYKCRD